MRRVGVPLTCMTLALAACNMLTGATELEICETCGGDSSPVTTSTDSSADVTITADATVDARDASDGSTKVDAPADAVADVVDAAVGCNGAAACERVVFVTSNSFTGNLGDIAGADAKCQAAADGSPLARIKGRTFLAWVSTSLSNATTRHVHGSMRYVGSNGTTTIANDWNDLTDNDLANGISQDENGGNQGGNTWTGTKSGGATFDGLGCNGWTASTNVNGGVIGNVGGNGGGWSGAGADGCNATHRLYCFEK